MMKWVLSIAVLACMVGTTFGHGAIVSSSTDGNGRFEYVVENLGYGDLDDVMLLFGYENVAVYDAEGPVNWSFNINASETIFIADEPSAYLPPESQATFVLFSEYTESTYILHPVWGTDRLGNEIFLYNTEVISPVPESITLIEQILEFFDTSVADGTLVGVGPGKSASNRLKALRNMLEATNDLIAGEYFEDACEQLVDILKKCDGQVPPPDFVSGEATEELANKILELMEDLECE